MDIRHFSTRSQVSIPQLKEAVRSGRIKQSTKMPRCFSDPPLKDDVRKISQKQIRTNGMENRTDTEASSRGKTENDN